MYKSTLRYAGLTLVFFLITASLAFPKNSWLKQTGTNFTSAEGVLSGRAEPSPVTFMAEPGVHSSPLMQADWFVILGSFRDRNRADERAGYFTDRGYDVNVTTTNVFVNWTPDLWAVVMGPYTQKTAKQMMRKVRSFDKNVYIKRGIVGG
jgi:hypothetical protein